MSILDEPTDPDAGEPAALFTGRDWVFRRLDAFLTGTDRVFLITGGPGTGKSAIARRLIEMNAGKASVDTYAGLGVGFLFHAHFCRANDPDRIRPSRLVEALSSHLGTAFEPCQEAIQALGRQGGTNISVTVKADRADPGARVYGIGTLNVSIGERLSPTDAFLDLVAGPLVSLEQSGDHRPIVVLVDALDEALAYAPDAESRTIPGLLGTILQAPDALPPTVRFVLTSRPDGRVLRSLRKRPDLDLIDDAPQDVDDVSDYTKGQFEHSPRLRAKAESLAAKVAQASAGNFLYAHHVVKDLLDHPDLADEIDAMELPEGLEGIYGEFLGRELARDGASWEDRYRPVLGLLAVAQGDGLTAQQIAGAAGITRTQLAGPLRASTQYLAGPEPDGPYRIYHQSFREFLLEDDEYRVEPQEANQALAEYFVNEYEGVWGSTTDSYAVSHTPAHLVEAIVGAPRRTTSKGLRHKLVGLLTDIGFLEARTALLGIDEVLRSFRDALPLLPGEDTSVGQVYRVLDLEAHNLRGWERAKFPAFFCQQVQSRALPLDLDAVIDPAHARLEVLGVPYWQLRWRSRGESPELERTLIGHDGPVRAVAISADGLRAISGSTDGTVRVWSLTDGRELQVLMAQEPTLLPPTPENRRRPFWDTEAGREVLVPSKHTRAVDGVAISEDGLRALSGSRDRMVRLWDTETGKELLTLSGHTDSVMTVAITADGRWGVSGSWDGTVRVWDLDSGVESRKLTGHAGPVLEVAVTPDGRWAASGSWDQTARVWNLSTGEEFAVLRGHDAQVSAIAITREGDRVLTGSRDMTLRLWDVGNRTELRTLFGHQYSVEAVTLTADGRTAISASWDRTVRVWSLESGREMRSLTGHEEQVWAVAASPNGARVVSGSWDRTVRVWNLREDPVRTALRGHTGAIDALSESPDGRLAVSGSRDGTARIWDVKTGRELHVLEGHAERVSAVSFAPNAEFVVTGSWDGVLNVWDAATGSHSKTLRGHRAAVLCLLITADGRRVVSGSWDHDLRVWDLATGQTTSTLVGHGGPVWGIALLRSDHAVSASHDSTLRIWNLVTGKMMRELAGHRRPVTTLSVTPDGSRVASGSQDGTVKTWDVKTGHLIWSREITQAEIVAVSAAPLGRVIAGALDGRLRVWTMEEGNELLSLDVHRMHGVESTAPPITVRASRDGSAAMSGAFDRRLAYWGLPSGVPSGVAALDGAITTMGSPSDDGSILVGDAAGCLYHFRWISA